MVQQLSLQASTARDVGSIPGQGTRIPQTWWLGQKKKELLQNKTAASSFPPKKLQTPALKFSQLCHKPEGRPSSRRSISLCVVIYSLQSALRTVILSEPPSKEMEMLIIPVLQRPALRPRVQALAAPPPIVQGGAKC